MKIRPTLPRSNWAFAPVFVIAGLLLSLGTTPAAASGPKVISILVQNDGTQPVEVFVTSDRKYASMVKAAEKQSQSSSTGVNLKHSGSGKVEFADIGVELASEKELGVTVEESTSNETDSEVAWTWDNVTKGIGSTTIPAGQKTWFSVQEESGEYFFYLKRGGENVTRAQSIQNDRRTIIIDDEFYSLVLPAEEPKVVLTTGQAYYLHTGGKYLSNPVWSGPNSRMAFTSGSGVRVKFVKVAGGDEYVRNNDYVYLELFSDQDVASNYPASHVRFFMGHQTNVFLGEGKSSDEYQFQVKIVAPGDQWKPEDPIILNQGIKLYNKGAQRHVQIEGDNWVNGSPDGMVWTIRKG